MRSQHLTCLVASVWSHQSSVWVVNHPCLLGASPCLDKTCPVVPAESSVMLALTASAIEQGNKFLDVLLTTSVRKNWVLNKFSIRKMITKYWIRELVSYGKITWLIKHVGDDSTTDGYEKNDSSQKKNKKKNTLSHQLNLQGSICYNPNKLMLLHTILQPYNSYNS